MKTHGIPSTQTLVDLFPAEPDAAENTYIEVGGERYRLDTLCPRGRHWPLDPSAPWNAPHETDPAWWREEYPEAWGETADDDPAAPWNNGPDRDPANYLTDEGEPMLWEIPHIVPLVKLPQPDDGLLPGQKWEPVLVWFEDRVERDWQAAPMSAAEIAQAQAGAVRQLAADLLAIFADMSATQRGRTFPARAGMKLALEEGDLEAAKAIIEGIDPLDTDEQAIKDSMLALFP